MDATTRGTNEQAAREMHAAHCADVGGHGLLMKTWDELDEAQRERWRMMAHDRGIGRTAWLAGIEDEAARAQRQADEYGGLGLTYEAEQAQGEADYYGMLAAGHRVIEEHRHGEAAELGRLH